MEEDSLARYLRWRQFAWGVPLLALACGATPAPGNPTAGAGGGDDTASAGSGGASGSPNTLTGGGDRRVRVEGALQKGPFLLGSSVTASLLDASLNPTGQVFNTETNNDRGEFALDYPGGDAVSLEGDGYYFDEVSGVVSSGRLTLRALSVPGESDTERVMINMVTHLTTPRVKALVVAATPFADAVTQAERELARELDITKPGYQPGRRGVELDLGGGNDDDNAYLLGVSAVLIQASLLAQGSTGQLQELLNRFATDLSDGELDDSNRATLGFALKHLEVDRVHAHLHERMTALGISSEVPDLRRVLDQERCCRHGQESWGCRDTWRTSDPSGGPACDTGLYCSVDVSCMSEWPQGCCKPKRQACGDGDACAADEICDDAGACFASGLERCCRPTGGAGERCGAGGVCDTGLVCLESSCYETVIDDQSQEQAQSFSLVDCCALPPGGDGEACTRGIEQEVNGVQPGCEPALSCQESPACHASGLLRCCTP